MRLRYLPLKNSCAMCVYILCFYFMTFLCMNAGRVNNYVLVNYKKLFVGFLF